MTGCRTTSYALIRGLLSAASPERCYHRKWRFRAFASYDVVLCDWRMPFLDGLTLLDRIRQLRSHAPVLLMTGDIEESVEQRASQEGAFALLRKPLDREEVVQVIEAALLQSKPQMRMAGNR